MTIVRKDLFRAAHWATLASAIAILLSIAVSQILLGLALALLFASREKLRLPRIWLPLGLFLLGTLISLAFSPEPMNGMPQVKKMFVFAMLLAVCSTVRDFASVRKLFLAWAAVGAFVAVWAIGQFIGDLRQASALHRDFYQFYMPHRITGAMNHWMTFAGQEMVVLLMLAAFLLFAPLKRWWLWAACAALLAVAEVLNETRTVWLGLAVAGCYLLWNWSRTVAIVAPLLLLSVLWFSPGQIHQRFVSIFQPRRDLDSNEFRYIMDRTGWAMIEAHPLLGIGPEEAKYHMKDWIPADISRPLPSGFYQHLHNVYLQYAAERGIPTMLMLLWMLVLILYDFSMSLFRLPPGRSLPRFLLAGGIACVLGIMVSGLFEVNLGDTEVLTVFLVVVACGYLAVESGQAKMAETGKDAAPASVNGMQSPAL